LWIEAVVLTGGCSVTDEKNNSNDKELAHKLDKLSREERSVIEVLWSRPDATLGEMHEAVGRRTGATYGEVVEVAGTLERKGLARHRVEDRTYIYEALVAKPPEEDKERDPFQGLFKSLDEKTADEPPPTKEIFKDSDGRSHKIDKKDADSLRDFLGKRKPKPKLFDD
jgi:predicted transcriptional regulator